MNSHPKLFSTMRPSGRLHLGHYFGALQNWRKYQYEYESYFMLADISSLTNQYNPELNLEELIETVVIDWLASGIDPSQATIFIQSKVPEHFELSTLLAAVTPLSWLERVPSYKEKIDELEHTDLSTYGFLGLPLLQAANILAYNSKFVLINEEQLANIEFVREVARRFNHLFGREEGFEEKAQLSIKKLGSKKAEIYEQLLMEYQQEGNEESLERARFLLQDALNLAHGDRERLFAFLENKSKVIFNEPQAIFDKSNIIMGVDGQKMSNKANNCIYLRESEEEVSKKIRSMPTDPARIRRTDRGNPECCPVWKLHQVYSDKEVKEWAEMGCISAGIGCLDCKQPLIDKINEQQSELRENARIYEEDPTLVKRIITDGCNRARDVASDTLKEIKQTMNINY
ncbi:MAG: tryptophan--tRNA ligase [Neisseriales bacterium]|nr:MAG: tryptophan--tRNA ligase [Neisseriales bacterium]